MRKLTPVTISLLLVACADAPPALVTPSPAAVAETGEHDPVLRDLRRPDRHLIRTDPALGVLLPLKWQPADITALRRTLASALPVPVNESRLQADLNEFDIYQKADGTLTLRLAMILRQGDRATLQRLTRSLTPAGGQSLEAACRQLTDEAMGALAKTLAPSAQPAP